MVVLASLFYVNLPNATTWFCFSFLLAGALFFKFSRVLSVRNWDVITLFLLAPGLLLLQEANATSDTSPITAGPTLTAGPLTIANEADSLRWFGYLWLLCGSGYFLFRSLLDLTLVRRVVGAGDRAAVRGDFEQVTACGHGRRPGLAAVETGMIAGRIARLRACVPRDAA